MVHFVGAGSGAPDLITVRGQRLLAEADVIIYAGSLVNPALLEYKKDGCLVYDSAKMTLERQCVCTPEIPASTARRESRWTSWRKPGSNTIPRPA